MPEVMLSYDDGSEVHREPNRSDDATCAHCGTQIWNPMAAGRYTLIGVEATRLIGVCCSLMCVERRLRYALAPDEGGCGDG